MSFEKHFSDDGGRHIEWGRTSVDYAQHRPNYPAEFFARLADRDIGVPGQRILDLGTGVGFLAQQFAIQGASVVGIDIDAGQIAIVQQRAAEANVHVDFRVAPAENTGLDAISFDVISASQCWLYFDQPRTCREVIRLLRLAGRLMTCHFCWLPFLDDTARRTEELVLKYNPSWTGAGYDGVVPRRAALDAAAVRGRRFFCIRRRDPIHPRRLARSDAGLSRHRRFVGGGGDIGLRQGASPTAREYHSARLHRCPPHRLPYFASMWRFLHATGLTPQLAIDAPAAIAVEYRATAARQAI